MWVIVLKWILYVVAASLACFTVGWLGREIFRALFGLSSTRRDELLRIFLVLTGILVTLSLLSFDPKDYTTLDLLSFDVHDTVSNKGGVIGAILSLWLYMGLGPSSLMIPVVLLLWGILPRRFYQILPMRTAFLLGVAVLVSFIVAGLPQTGAGSSIIGDKLSTAGSQYLGVGKWLVAAAFVFGLCLTFPGMRGLVSGIPAWIGRLTSGIGSLRKPKIISEEPEPELVKEEIEEEKEPEIVKSEPVSHEIEKPQQELPVEESPPALDASEFKALFLDSLKEPESVSKSESESELKDRAKVLEQKFEQFAISGEITKIAPGPVITRYEYKPAPGIKLSRIAGLSDDIALSMKSTRIRIVAPIPGKSVIGIEVPNQDRECVYLKQVLTSPIFESLESKLGVVLGSDIAGEPVCDDIAGFPHLLIAGTTGSGKSVCVNTMIASILYRATPQDVRFLMIDPKRLELRVYNGIPHLVRPVISDSKESLEALKKALLWMEIRYKEFARVGVRDIQGYNERVDEPKPYILVIIDEKRS
jgi:S-DNA-T family DNA segregation ATPase FtsK/SpoIIIE